MAKKKAVKEKVVKQKPVVKRAMPIAKSTKALKVMPTKQVAKPVARKALKKKLKQIQQTRNLIEWIVGLVFIVIAVLSISKSLAAVILMIAGGLLLLPPVVVFLEKKVNLNLSGWLRVIVAVILFAIGASMVS